MWAASPSVAASQPPLWRLHSQPPLLASHGCSLAPRIRRVRLGPQPEQHCAAFADSAGSTGPLEGPPKAASLDDPFSVDPFADDPFWAAGALPPAELEGAAQAALEAERERCTGLERELARTYPHSFFCALFFRFVLFT